MSLRRPTAMGRFARVVLVVDLAAVTVAGIQLFVLSTRTSDYFAWTIKAPLTAALLGAGYWSSIPMLVLALRSREWQRVRTLFVMGLATTWFATLATFWHLEQFHLRSGATVSRLAAWAWLAVYVAVPLMLFAALVVQERAGGRFDYATDAPLLRWVRAVLVLHAAPLTVLGLGLAFFPGSFADLWPWPLTPLTAGAVAGWLLTIAAGGWWSLREGDWRRIRVAFPGLIVFPLLALAGVARFSDAVDFSDARTWVYLGALVSSPTLIGLAAVHQEQRARAGDTSGRPA